ncbi:MAG TPA: regulatory protein RecX [Aeromonadales bacterium]|nr:regulatory protein RecX [Aeromonadales bacterium]
MTKIKKQSSAWMVAQSYLARREYSRKELSEKLTSREFAANEIERVLDELVKRGWQSDQRYCESFVRFRVMKGQGPRKIQYELQQKGVNSEIITSVLQLYDAQWLQLCENVLTKKYATTEPLSLDEKAKRYRFLNTRGFPADIIRQVMG